MKANKTSVLVLLGLILLVQIFTACSPNIQANVSYDNDSMNPPITKTLTPEEAKIAREKAGDTPKRVDVIVKK